MSTVVNCRVFGVEYGFMCNFPNKRGELAVNKNWPLRCFLRGFRHFLGIV